MALKAGGTPSEIIGADIIEHATYEKIDWKELKQDPLTTLQRIFGKDYLLSNIGARPDQKTFIELDQIRNFSHLMIQYAVTNRVIGPLKELDPGPSKKPFPSDLEMDRQKPPIRLNKFALNLGNNQNEIDTEEVLLAQLVAGHAESLKPYSISQDLLENALKKNSPDPDKKTAGELLPPSLVEQIVKNVYIGLHKTDTTPGDEDNITQAIKDSWTLINQRLGGILKPTESTLKQDRVDYDLQIRQQYLDEHRGYREKQSSTKELREKRLEQRLEEIERRKSEMNEYRAQSTAEQNRKEEVTSLRAGILFPEMPPSERRTQLYKNALKGAQAIEFAKYILKNNETDGLNLITTFERSFEPELQLKKVIKQFESLIVVKIFSRDLKDSQMLNGFVESASLEYFRLYGDTSPITKEMTEFEETINSETYDDDMVNPILSKLEIEAQKLLTNKNTSDA